MADDFIIANKYKVSEVIHDGKLSKVCIGKHINKNENVIIKFEDNRETNLLEHEAGIYLHLMRHVPKLNIPKFKTFGVLENYNYIVIEKMDYSLYDIIQKHSITLEDTLTIGIQLLFLLKKFHSQKLVHRDIKPENIVFDKKHTIYLIDFGLSTTYNKDQPVDEAFDTKSSDEYRKYVSSKGKNKFVGNVNFSSISAHDGYSYQPKDDLLSVSYMLLYIYYGNLPWTIFKIDNHKPELVRSIKRNVDFLQYFCDFHHLSRESINTNPLFKLYHRILHMTIDQSIDYESLCDILNYETNTDKHTFSWSQS